jgi:hypothetical protein
MTIDPHILLLITNCKRIAMQCCPSGNLSLKTMALQRKLTFFCEDILNDVIPINFI